MLILGLQNGSKIQHKFNKKRSRFGTPPNRIFYDFYCAASPWTLGRGLLPLPETLPFGLSSFTLDNFFRAFALFPLPGTAPSRVVGWPVFAILMILGRSFLGSIFGPLSLRLLCHLGRLQNPSWPPFGKICAIFDPKMGFILGPKRDPRAVLVRSST